MMELQINYVHVWHNVQNVFISFFLKKTSDWKLSKLHCVHVFSYCQENNSTIYFFICWTFRFMSASVEHNIQTYILELVHDQLTRRQTLDSITRNLLKLLTVTCGYSQIRLLVSQRLEMWLQNPKVYICFFVYFFFHSHVVCQVVI